MVKKTDNQKYIYIGVIVVLVIILGFVFISNQHPLNSNQQNKIIAKPILSVTGVTSKSGADISRGCYTTVSGYVSNTGNANANGVAVTCSVDGGGSHTGRQVMGSVIAGDNSYFNYVIDNDCPYSTYARCQTTCNNC